MSWFKNFIPNWEMAMRADKYLFYKLFFLIFVGVLNPYIFSYVFPIIQQREGVMLVDPFLDYIPAKDMSSYLFGLLYFILFTTTIYLFGSPKHLKIGMKLYVVIGYMRMACIYLISLEPPLGLVYLHDPVLEATVYGDNIITKDLFFSGHAATVSCCFFAMQAKPFKWVIGVLAVIVSVMLLVQHIHYTIDIIGAWILSYLVYKFLSAQS